MFTINSFCNHSSESFLLYIILTWREEQSFSVFLLRILFLRSESVHFVLRQFFPHSFNHQWSEQSSVAAEYSKEKAKQTAGLYIAFFGNKGTNPIKDAHIFYLNLQNYITNKIQGTLPWRWEDFMCGSTNWTTNGLKSSGWPSKCENITNTKTPKTVSTLVLLQVPPHEALSNGTVQQAQQPPGKAPTYSLLAQDYTMFMLMAS